MYKSQKEMVKAIIGNLNSYLPNDILKEIAHKPTLDITKQYVEKSKLVKSSQELEEITDKFQQLIAHKVIITILDQNKITNKVIKRLPISSEEYELIFAEIKGLKIEDENVEVSLVNDDEVIDKLLEAKGEDIQKNVFKMEDTIDIRHDLTESIEKEENKDIEEKKDFANIIREEKNIREDNMRLHKLDSDLDPKYSEEQELMKKLSDKIIDKRIKIKVNRKLIETIATYYINTASQEYQILVENRCLILVREFLNKDHYTSITQQCIEFEDLILSEVLDKLRDEWILDIEYPDRLLID